MNGAEGEEGILMKWNLHYWYQQLEQDGISTESDRKDMKYRSNYINSCIYGV